MRLIYLRFLHVSRLEGVRQKSFVAVGSYKSWITILLQEQKVNVSSSLFKGIPVKYHIWLGDGGLGQSERWFFWPNLTSKDFSYFAWSTPWSDCQYWSQPLLPAIGIHCWCKGEKAPFYKTVCSEKKILKSDTYSQISLTCFLIKASVPGPRLNSWTASQNLKFSWLNSFFMYARSSCKPGEEENLKIKLLWHVSTLFLMQTTVKSLKPACPNSKTKKYVRA